MKTKTTSICNIQAWQPDTVHHLFNSTNQYNMEIGSVRCGHSVRMGTFDEHGLDWSKVDVDKWQVAKTEVNGSKLNRFRKYTAQTDVNVVGQRSGLQFHRRTGAQEHRSRRWHPPMPVVIDIQSIYELLNRTRLSG